MTVRSLPAPVYDSPTHTILIGTMAAIRIIGAPLTVGTTPRQPRRARERPEARVQQAMARPEGVSAPQDMAVVTAEETDL
jgi:hypothetical protein